MDADIRIQPRSTGSKAAIASALVLFSAGFEGVRRVAYFDPPGVLTVCQGHTGKDIDPHHVYTIAECKAFAETDAMAAVSEVLRCAPGAPDAVALSFGDAVFNLGSTIACDRNRSTAARLLYAHDWVGACNQLPRWNQASIAGHFVPLPGLTKRRAAERLVCLGPAPAASGAL